MMRDLAKRTPLFFAFSVVALLFLTGNAWACPCDEFCGKVAAHGTSLYGVPWRIAVDQRPTAAHSKQLPTGELSFSIGDCGTPDEVGQALGIEVGSVGWSVGILLPLSSRFGLSAGSGTKIAQLAETFGMERRHHLQLANTGEDRSR